MSIPAKRTPARLPGIAKGRIDFLESHESFHMRILQYPCIRSQQRATANSRRRNDDLIGRVAVKGPR